MYMRRLFRTGGAIEENVKNGALERVVFEWDAVPFVVIPLAETVEQ